MSQFLSYKLTHCPEAATRSLIAGIYVVTATSFAVLVFSWLLAKAYSQNAFRD
ncbi:hypothetical protein EV356DRAFT_503834 [Viridothelium virens]|uniref:Uncharacterized protein n=1 Tax=Viridothelium virens TaxID=1048519 RepID=A0A6A6H573_VIRVR|nr:hypothetical protein EV356DRAFT_503834 [Viridothelium virens]